MRKHDNKPVPGLSSGRRNFLKSLPVAGAALVAPPAAMAAMVGPATADDLKRYFAFLHFELSRLAAESGFDRFDFELVGSVGGKQAYAAAYTAPASSRAKAVLAMGSAWTAGDVA